jgi:farnesyl diphosphate synthase
LNNCLQFVMKCFFLCIGVCAGKLNRGLSVVDSLKLLKEEALSETDVFNACALGWCIEWV